MRASLVGWGLFLASCGGLASGADAAASDAARGDAGLVDAALVDGALADVGTEVDASGGSATTLRIVYPSGHRIVVRGAEAPLDWTSGLEARDLGTGVYELALEGLVVETELKPFLDDASWARGPNYHLAPGQAIEIAPHFVPGEGRVVTLLDAWASPALGNTRAVYAYLPAGYDENAVARFPVLWMHDGQNLFDRALAFGGHEWQVDETMDAAAEGGHCVASGASCAFDGSCAPGDRCDTFAPTIVVGVENTAARIDEYTPVVDPSYGGGDADAYLSALTGDLLPRVRAILRTRTEAESTAMMGSSLGGLVTVHAGATHAGTFGRLGAMSPSTWWNDRWILGEVLALTTPRAVRVYVDSGDSGSSMDGVTDTADLAAAYRTLGYVEGADLRYVVEPGGTHDEASWARRLPRALDFLLPPRERPFAPR